MAHHVTCHVTAMSHAPLSLIKRKRKRNSKKRNIKSRKIDKRKRKMFSSYVHHNKLGSCNLTTLADITSSMVYGPTYQSTNFFTGLSLNIKSFILNITLSLTFYSSAFFLTLFACPFISSCALFNAAPTSSYTFLILPACCGNH